MKTIRLYMQRLDKGHLNFWLLDKSFKEGTEGIQPDFSLKRFDPLELQKCLFSVKEYGLLPDDTEYAVDLEIGKSEHEDSIFVINNEEKDELMLLRKLNISSGNIRGGGYSKLESCIFLSRKLSEIKISNIDVGTMEVISETPGSIISMNYVNIKSFTTEAGYSANIKNSSLQELIILNASLESSNLKLSLESSIIDNINCNNNHIESFEIYKTIIKGGKILDTTINTFSIESSDFGELNFINLIFNQPVRIIKSYIEKIRLFNVKWHNNLLDEKNINPLNLKDAYRQLKHIYDNSSNQTEANKFFAKEMEYHMKALKESGDWKNYLIAWLQKEVSDFGNDWVRAFISYILLVTFGFICFQIYKVLQPDLIFDCSWNGFKKGMEDFTEFANPIPKVEDITNPLLLLFSLLKILIVYQIIVALRRISQR